MDDGVDTTNNDEHRPSPKAMADDANAPREPSPFDGDDSAMLDDANEANKAAKQVPTSPV